MPTIDIHAHFVDRFYLDDLIRVMKLDVEHTRRTASRCSAITAPPSPGRARPPSGR
jgi:hypothetical protein